MSEALMTAKTSPQDKELAITNFQGMLESYQTNISALLETKGVSKQEFMVTVMNLAIRNPKILECTKESILGAVFTCAELGLMPNTPFGYCYIIPYNNNKGTKSNPDYVMEAQFQMGYPGWIELYDKQNKIQWVDCQLVHENDEFKEIKGTDPQLIHVPTDGDRGERKGTYAVAKMTSGQVIWVYMNAEEVLQIKKKSPGAYYKDGNENKSSPWMESNDPMGWMWMKCPLKQLGKKLPKTREIELSIYAQDSEEVGESIKIDPSSKQLKLDELSSEEEKNQTKAGDKNEKVAEGMKDMLTPNKDVSTRAKIAVRTFTTKYGVTEDQLCKKLKIDNVKSIGEPELDQLTEIRGEAKKRDVKVAEFFS